MEKIDIEQLLEIEKSLYDQGDKCAFINGEVVPLSQPQYLKIHYSIYEEGCCVLMDYLRSQNLSKEEGFLLCVMTGGGSDWINHALSQRKPKLDELQRKFVSYLDDILKKMEGYDKTPMVYHFDKVAEGREDNARKWFERYKGRIIKVPWSLSTTQDNDWEKTHVVWKIKLLSSDQTKGHDVRALQPSEQEIRFERNATFKIQEIKEEKSKILIALVEVDAIEDVTLHDGDYDRL